MKLDQVCVNGENMRKIKKGTKVNQDCYIITEKEMIKYTNAYKTLCTLKEKADNYQKQYKS